MNKKVVHKTDVTKHKIFGKFSILQLMLAIGVAALVGTLVLRCLF